MYESVYLSKYMLIKGILVHTLDLIPLEKAVAKQQLNDNRWKKNYSLIYNH